MDINTLQYVVGEVKADAPATIRFFGSVTEENTSRFNDEFDFLAILSLAKLLKIGERNKLLLMGVIGWRKREDD